MAKIIHHHLMGSSIRYGGVDPDSISFCWGSNIGTSGHYVGEVLDTTNKVDSFLRTYSNLVSDFYAQLGVPHDNRVFWYCCVAIPKTLPQTAVGWTGNGYHVNKQALIDLITQHTDIEVDATLGVRSDRISYWYPFSSTPSATTLESCYMVALNVPSFIYSDGAKVQIFDFRHKNYKVLDSRYYRKLLSASSLDTFVPQSEDLSLSGDLKTIRLIPNKKRKQQTYDDVLDTSSFYRGADRESLTIQPPPLLLNQYQSDFFGGAKTVDEAIRNVKEDIKTHVKTVRDLKEYCTQLKRLIRDSALPEVSGMTQQDTLTRLIDLESMFGRLLYDDA